MHTHHEYTRVLLLSTLFTLYTTLVRSPNKLSLLEQHARRRRSLLVSGRDLEGWGEGVEGAEAGGTGEGRRRELRGSHVVHTTVWREVKPTHVGHS